jgi:hypothetical protein
MPCDDPYHAAVIISGRNPEELARAVRAFSCMSYPFPDNPSVIVAEIVAPDPAPYIQKSGLTHGKTYDFSSLGFPSRTFTGINPIPAGFDFRIPSDMHLPAQFATLRLNMAYSGPMRNDSALKVTLNDKFIASVAFEGARGGTYKDYELHVPLSSLKPGLNRMQFAPVLTPLVTDQCAMIQADNLALTIFGSSKSTLPEMAHWIQMPHLEAMMADAFPFGKRPDLRETVMCVANADYASAEAASLPDGFLKDAPIDIVAPGRVPAPQIVRPRCLEKSPDIWLSDSDAVSDAGRGTLPNRPIPCRASSTIPTNAISTPFPNMWTHCRFIGIKAATTEPPGWMIQPSPCGLSCRPARQRHGRFPSRPRACPAATFLKIPLSGGIITLSTTGVPARTLKPT